MALTARPSKKIDLSKIDEIQNEFFDDDDVAATTNEKSEEDQDTDKKADELKESGRKKRESTAKSSAVAATTAPRESTPRTPPEDLEKTGENVNQRAAPEQGSLKLADLLATEKTGGVRHTSRPYTVPRSLTIDLNRMKSKFKTRDLHYTQNELMDKMVKESLETVTAENYYSLREKAFAFVKSPEQSSRRTVTLTEEAAVGMNELKADLALKQNRRVSSDEIFTTLLAIAFSSLYENNLL